MCNHMLWSSRSGELALVAERPSLYGRDLVSVVLGDVAHERLEESMLVELGALKDVAVPISSPAHLSCNGFSKGLDGALFAKIPT